MILRILTWYIVLQSFAFVGLPLTFRWFRHLPSRGYAASKALGLLISGIVFWWGGIIQLWNNDNAATLTSMGAILLLGIWVMRNHWQQVLVWWKSHRNFVLVTEILFLGMLVLWAFVRATQPDLQTAGGEKWMEIAFLNAVLRSPQLPPHDPWLSGYGISYYYLGYILLGMLTRLSTIPATIAFNLGAAGWMAMAACVSYNIVYDLLKKRDALRPLLAPLMLLLTGNAEGLLEVLHAQGKLPAAFWTWMSIGRLSTPPTPPFTTIPRRFFWWWQASRTLRDCAPWNLPWATCTGQGQMLEMIDEFPAFSFILGDMHPHVLSLPFVLLAILFGLNVYRSGFHQESEDNKIFYLAALGLGDKVDALVSRFVPLLSYAVILGALGFINTWDFPIYWAVVVGSMLLGRYSQREKSFKSLWDSAWSLLPEAFVLGVLSIVFYFPFWFSLRSQAGGILPNVFHATRLRQFTVMFFPLIIPVTGVIITALRSIKVRWHKVLLVGLGLALGITLVGFVVGFPSLYPYLVMITQGEAVQGYAITPDHALLALQDRLSTPWTGLLLACGLSAVLLTLTKHNSTVPDAKVDTRSPFLFPLLLTLMGLLLTLAPEFIYLKDVFLTRMNTIFKFYFQAWVFWSLVGAWQLASWMRPVEQPTKHWVRIGLVVLSVLFIIVGLIYTVLAIPARSSEQGTPWTLDGAAWVAQRFPQDYAAIQWINDNIDAPAVIVEAPGDNHRAYVYEGRVSALTGLPTLLGWGGHQRQWRGNYEIPALREVDIEMLYTTIDETLTRAVLAQYDVEYIYVGPLERQRYSLEGLMKFDVMFPVVYDKEGVKIYFVEETLISTDVHP